MKKKKVDINISCDITQTSPGPVQPIIADKWDTLNMSFNWGVTAFVADQCKKDPELRQQLLDRTAERVNELIDSVTLR